MGPFAEFIDCSRPVVIAAHADDEVIGQRVDLLRRRGGRAGFPT